ncbi:MAG: VWA domain-containing protein [Alistipes sp.]
MFRFANSYFLWLLLVIPVLSLLFWLFLRSRSQRLARLGNPVLLSELMPEVSTGRMKLKFIILCASLTCLILAIARPQFGSKLREEQSKGIEMMLVVDVSNSMLAEDFEPNRLDRTKYAINKLFDELHQDRIGLVVFAGEPKVQLPITSDYRMAKAFARKIDPSLVSVQGTAIGAALSQALMSFSSDTQENHSRAVILITDGENHEDDALAAAQRAEQMGIRIYTIGIGTPEGAPIRINGEFIKDEKGDMVVSKLNEEMLQQIADQTGGAYVRASKQSIGLEEIVKSINQMEQTELSTMRFEEFNEQYQYLAALALLLLLIEFSLLDRHNPLLSRFNIFRENKK